MEGPVLRNLRDCMHANTQPPSSPLQQEQGQGQGQAREQEAQGMDPAAGSRAQIPGDDELFDDAESVEDFCLDDLVGTPAPAQAQASIKHMHQT